MRSKTSKRPKTSRSTKRDEPRCSEERLKVLASECALALKLGDRILLSGELGAGKSTFARCLLEALGVERAFEGSPSFPIVHPYQTRLGRTFHIDFYRLKSEREIEEAGLVEALWDFEALVICEWISNWPKLVVEMEKTLPESAQIWAIDLKFVDQEPGLRSVNVEVLKPPLPGPTSSSAHKRT